MEPASKSGRCNPLSKDRLSNLPDHIAYHILCFLAIKDIARLSCTSKKCRELCLSIPSLIIDAMQYNKNPFERIRFMDFIDRLMTRRMGTVTRSFRLRWHVQKWIYDEEYRIRTWLHNALGCNINSLDLDLCLETGVFVMPLHCESLTFLKLDLSKGKLKLPSPYGFTNLQSLSLKHVVILDKFFGEWISSCKFLNKLYLEQLYGVKKVNITSSSLKNIDIRSDEHTDLYQLNISAKSLEHMQLYWIFNPLSGTSLKIHAPNLSNLSWIGFAPDYYCLGKLNSLQDATVNVISHPHSSRSHSRNLLGYIDGTKDLRIYENCIKSLFKEGCLPASLNNLKRLKIVHSSLNDDLVPAMAVFLKGLPHNMETLLMTQFSIASNEASNETRLSNLSSLNASGFKAQFWESQNILFTLQLKEVEIKLFKGENELELVEYLLEHAKELKKLVILYKPPLPLKIRMKVNEFTMANTAEVYFHSKGSLRALELKLLHDVIKE